MFSQDNLSQSPPITLPQHNQMPNIIFDSSKIKHVLKANKSSSPGPDNLHSFALKNLSDELAIPLSIIFTKSYQEYINNIVYILLILSIICLTIELAHIVGFSYL